MYNISVTKIEMEMEKKKRRVGRPRKADKLAYDIRVRISKEGKARLEKMAKEAEGNSISGVVRELIESAPGSPRIPDPENWKKLTPKEKEEWYQRTQE